MTLPTGWSKPTSSQFNLLDEPWIPVRANDGTQQNVGLLHLFEQSDRIRAVESESALIDVAILRLCLAILHRAIDGPKSREEWYALDARATLGPPVAPYLEKWRDRFFLFDPNVPFMQVAAEQLLSGVGSVAQLDHTAASGTNKKLFDKSIDKAPSRVVPARAARLLLAAQSFAAGAGSGYPASRIGSRSMLLVPQAGSFGASLLRSATRYDPAANEPFAARGDKPAWESDGVPVRSSVAPLLGYLDLLTRRLRLVWLLVADGDPLATGLCAHHAGLKFEDDVTLREPSLIIRVNAKKGSTYTQKSPLGAPVWRELPAVLATIDQHNAHSPLISWLRGSLDLGEDLKLRIVALDNDKAKYVAVEDATVNLPDALLRDANRRFSASQAIIAAGLIARSIEKHLGRNVEAKARCTRAYYGSLRPSLERLVVALASPTANSRTTNNAWRTAVRGAVNAAIKESERAARTRADDLQEAAKAEGKLWRDCEKTLSSVEAIDEAEEVEAA